VCGFISVGIAKPVLVHNSEFAEFLDFTDAVPVAQVSRAVQEVDVDHHIQIADIDSSSPLGCNLWVQAIHRNQFSTETKHLTCQ
jgi:hypothetical protein